MFWLSGGLLYLVFFSVSLYWQDPDWAKIDKPSQSANVAPGGTEVGDKEASVEAPKSPEEKEIATAESFAELLRERESKRKNTIGDILSSDPLEQNSDPNNILATETEEIDNSDLIGEYQSVAKKLSSESASKSSNNLPSLANRLRNQQSFTTKGNPLQDALNELSTQEPAVVNPPKPASLSSFQEPINNNNSILAQPYPQRENQFNQFNQPKVGSNPSFNSNLVSPGIQSNLLQQPRGNRPNFNNTRLQPFQGQQQGANQLNFNNQSPTFQGQQPGLNQPNFNQNQFHNFQGQQQGLNQPNFNQNQFHNFQRQ